MGTGLRPAGRRADLQHPFQLILQQHLVLCHRFHQRSNTFVNRQHLIRAGTGLRPRQGTKNILQLLALGIEDMAQGKLFHSDGGNDHR